MRRGEGGRWREEDMRKGMDEGKRVYEKDEGGGGTEGHMALINTT